MASQCHMMAGTDGAIESMALYGISVPYDGWSRWCHRPKRLPLTLTASSRWRCRSMRGHRGGWLDLARPGRLVEQKQPSPLNFHVGLLAAHHAIEWIATCRSVRMHALAPRRRNTHGRNMPTHATPRHTAPRRCSTDCRTCSAEPRKSQCRRMTVPTRSRLHPVPQAGAAGTFILAAPRAQKPSMWTALECPK